MIDRITTDLEKLYALKPNRLKHIYGVRDQAVKLGKIYGLDLEKLVIASLLHDITKYYTKEENIEIIKRYYDNHEEIISEFNEHILHAYSARVVAMKKYFISDLDILDSILSHTVGEPSMNMYQKIIFISDYTEINRTYESCVKVRKLVEDNLDLAVFTAIDDSIKFYENLNDLIPKTAYKARLYYRNILEEQNG